MCTHTSVSCDGCIPCSPAVWTLLCPQHCLRRHRHQSLALQAWINRNRLPQRRALGVMHSLPPSLRSTVYPAVYASLHVVCFDLSLLLFRRCCCFACGRIRSVHGCGRSVPVTVACTLCPMLLLSRRLQFHPLALQCSCAAVCGDRVHSLESVAGPGEAASNGLPPGSHRSRVTARVPKLWRDCDVIFQRCSLAHYRPRRSNRCWGRRHNHVH